MKRYAFSLLYAALLFPMGAAAQSFYTTAYNDSVQLQALGMSSNHRYVSGLNVMTYQAFVWDIEQNTVIYSPKDYANCDFRAVTNDGRAFGILGHEDMVVGYAAWLDAEGEEHFLDDETSMCYDVTPDGQIAVGALIDESWFPTACIWVDGQRQLLPVPRGSECGISHYGACAQFISADGSVIAGYLQDDFSTRPAIVWMRQSDGSYVADVLSAQYWGTGNPYRSFACWGISDSGEWLSLSVTPQPINDVPQSERVARYNLHTRQLQVSTKPISDAMARDYSYPSGIANNGALVGAHVYEDGYHRGLVWPADKECALPLAEVFSDKEQLATFDGFMNTPIDISADGRYIMGHTELVVRDQFGDTDLAYVTYLFDAGQVLSLDVVASTPAVQSFSIYNLYGQRLRGTIRGSLMVVDGKKTMIK